MLVAHFTTSEGNFTVRLFDAETPNTVANKHSVFGDVIEGLDVVSTIGGTATSKPGDRPVNAITIESVTIEEK